MAVKTRLLEGPHGRSLCAPFLQLGAHSTVRLSKYLNEVPVEYEHVDVMYIATRAPITQRSAGPSYTPLHSSNPGASSARVHAHLTHTPKWRA